MKSTVLYIYKFSPGIQQGKSQHEDFVAENLNKNM